MSEQEEMNRDSAAMLRALMQAALVVGEHLQRVHAERQRQAARAVGQQRAVLQARFDGEQRAAEAFLAVASSDTWWESADRAAIAEAWCTAVAWRELSPKAAAAEQSLREKIQRRYGLDPAEASFSGMATTVPLTEEMLAKAAWRRHRVRDNDAALNAVDLVSIREGLDREALYAFVVLHEQATAELNRLSNLTDPDRPVDADMARLLGDQHQALAASENALRGLGPVGQEWLRRFDDDRDMAYASVLASADPVERAKMWDIAGRLAAVRAEWVEAGHIGGEDERVAALHQEMAAVGEAGERWLAAHHNSLTRGTADRDRSLTWLRGNPAIEKEGLAQLEASLAMATFATPLASEAADLADQAKQAYEWFLDNDPQAVNRFNRDMAKSENDPEKLAGVYRLWVDKWNDARGQQKAASEPSSRGSARSTAGRPKPRAGRNFDPEQMKFSDAELDHARAYFAASDPEQVRKWNWKISNMGEDDYAVHSVHAEMVHRWRKEAHDTPERRAATAQNLDDAGVPERAKAARMAADVSNAKPASEAVRSTIPTTAPTAPPSPDLGAAKDFDLGG